MSTSGRLEYSTKKEACHYTEVSLEEAINAMKGALQLSEVKFGDTVWKQRGLPTGGMISRQSLSAALLPRERKWSIAEGGCESHAWGACRYVGDNLMIASGLCEPCLEQKVEDIYGPGLFDKGKAEGEQVNGHVWVDLELQTLGDSIVVLQKFPNFDFSIKFGEERKRPTILPYVGTIATTLNDVIAVGRSRLIRANEIDLPESA